jgi:hypothetical protein
MTGNTGMSSDGAHEAGAARLPVPSTGHPAVVRRSNLPVDRSDAAVPAVSDTLLAPMVAAALVTATAAAVVTGVTAASRWMWPWLAHGSPIWWYQSSPAGWIGPGVHIRYTHMEMHWPLDR